MGKRRYPSSPRLYPRPAESGTLFRACPSLVGVVCGTPFGADGVLSQKCRTGRASVAGVDDPVRVGSGWAARLWSRLGERPPSQAVIAAAAAAAAGLIVVEFVVLLVWVADTRSAASAATALRVGADLWVLAHGAAVELSGGRVDILPLGLAAIPVLLGASVGQRLGAPHGGAGEAAEPGGSPRQRWHSAAYRISVPPSPTAPGVRAAEAEAGTGGPPAPPAWTALVLDVLTVVLPYAAVVCVVAYVAADATARPSLQGALLGTVFLVGFGASAGVVRGRGGLGMLWQLLPVWARVPAAAGTAAAATAFAVACLGVAALLAARLPEIAAMTADLHAGIVGGIGLFAVQAALLPNLVLWGVAYALGSGFATGGGGLVRPSQVSAGTLPDLPLFAVLPDTSMPGSAWAVLAVLPVCAGVVLAVVAHRHARPGEAFAYRAAQVIGGAGFCGVLLAGAASLSGGSAGDAGRGWFGPSGHWTGLLAAGEVGVVALAVTVVVELLGRRQRPAGLDGVPSRSVRRRISSPNRSLQASRS